SRHPARRRRSEAETAPPPPRTAVSGHAPRLSLAVRERRVPAGPYDRVGVAWFFTPSVDFATRAPTARKRGTTGTHSAPFRLAAGTPVWIRRGPSAARGLLLRF